MQYFTSEDSIVRKIWGKSDTILFIFAGSSAEFALNKAVDWIYFTGKLPADPIGRLFSTVAYAKQIVFAGLDEANAAIDRISSIHSAVETARGSTIPDWAYRDVLYMLIHCSISSYEVLERRLTLAEKEEVFDVFNRVGVRMRLKDLPATYEEWTHNRRQHMEADLQRGAFTDDLFKQYKKHLGYFRYLLLLETQKLVVPAEVHRLLSFGRIPVMQAILPAYKMSRWLKADKLLKSLLLPRDFKTQVNALDEVNFSPGRTPSPAKGI